jgi:phosphoglycerate dehydrogenase-like enzyme
MSQTPPLTIWCNSTYPESAMQLLHEGLRNHRLVLAPRPTNLHPPTPDPLLDEADVAFGQPEVGQLMSSAKKLKRVHIDSAGYTRYDRDDLRTTLKSRGVVTSNSSSVYNEPCAQHVLAMILALARQIPQSVLNQHGPRAWPYVETRRNSHLLNGQTVLMLGFGSIARRLAELLQPFQLNVIATRRRPRGDEPVRVVADDQTDSLLPHANHVINILPDNPTTARYFTAERFARMKPAAYFYNIGRGTTVDQDALITALANKQIAGAYIDVMDPEPLPPEHALWRTPNCWITPHTGGGHFGEAERLMRHFLDNLARFTSARELFDQVLR